MVSARPPQATVRRVISAKPRVINPASGVETKSNAVDHSGGDGDYILDRAAQFHADHIVVAVEPEIGVAEGLLHLRGKIGIGGGHGDRRRKALGDLPCKRRAAESAKSRLKAAIAFGEHIGDDLGHAQQGFILNPFVAETSSISGCSSGFICVQHTARMVRWHHAENNLRSRQRLGKILGSGDALRHPTTAEKWLIYVRVAD